MRLWGWCTDLLETETSSIIVLLAKTQYGEVDQQSMDGSQHPISVQMGL